MFKRGLALTLVLGMVSVAQAGAVLELRPAISANTFNPCGQYSPGEAVAVDLWLTQAAGSERLLRLVHLHFDNTDVGLGVFDWLSDNATHYQDESPGPAALGDPAGVASAYTFEISTDLGPNAARQLTLPAASEVRVATLQVTMPAAPGSYTLDALTAASSVSFGFDAAGDATPITFWRGGTADLTGGTATFEVIAQAVIATAPVETTPIGQSSSLTRLFRNFAKLTFDTDLGPLGAIALQGQVEIVQMQANGLFGGDLSANFTYTIEDDGGGLPRTLRVQDDGGNMPEGWYSIRNTGAWGTVPPFVVQYRVLVGDIDGNGFVFGTDVSAVNSAFGPCLDCPEDIDGNGFVFGTDVAAANANFGPGPQKPTGHECD